MALFETLSQILLVDTTFDVWQGGILDILIFNSRRWIEDHQEDRTGGKQWNFENPVYTLHERPKCITYVGLFLQIKSHAKMRCPNDIEESFKTSTYFSHAFRAWRNTPETLTSFLVSIHPLSRELAHLNQKRTTHLCTFLYSLNFKDWSDNIYLKHEHLT